MLDEKTQGIAQRLPQSGARGSNKSRGDLAKKETE
jgi:hypothetical protein